MFKKILIVDDSQVQRGLIKAMCHQLPNIETLEASDGRWASRLLQMQNDIDLVITDLNMPGMDGIELLQQLARDATPPAVLLISGYKPELLEGCVLAAVQLGISRVAQMAKPLNPEKMQATIHSLLDEQPDEGSTTQALPLIEIINGLAHNQFCAHYQPIWRIGDRKLMQCEALARWQHPQRGLLGPAFFIDRLEHDGYISLLTRRIAQTSMDLLRQLAPKDTLHVSLNLARPQLNDAELLDRIEHELRLRRLSPAQVKLEITETTAFTDRGNTLATLLRLRMRGFALSLDDFGTGHTSLEDLKDLPFTELKLDRSLIHHIHRNPRCQSIVDGIVQIGEHLGMQLVAEGIEDEADMHYLERYPQLLAQGFLLSKPMSGTDLLELLSKMQRNSA
ncbi:EAL domain-containing protein [Chitinibacter sp. SCUT-21]|uniref:EAL domain-containing response regulator n=1 Tax=Chitinibacter sp. SCUT-21 TaxID=2970891 RepID=UPI0035A6A0C1